MQALLPAAEAALKQLALPPQCHAAQLLSARRLAGQQRQLLRLSSAAWLPPRWPPGHRRC
jgi:hypothetical protein